MHRGTTGLINVINGLGSKIKPIHKFSERVKKKLTAEGLNNIDLSKDVTSRVLRDRIAGSDKEGKSLSASFLFSNQLCGIFRLL